MKKLYFLSPLLFLFACSNDKKIPRLFTSDMLTTQLFSIDASKDTSLPTLHGAIIHITAGSFPSSGKVELEIKEAFTPAEILAAGLVTTSNGRPLQSRGMIYLNASVKDVATELIKPIRISIPNSYYDSTMQVFKGVADDSAGINWVDPAPVDSTPQSARWAAGKEIFRTKCTPCHRLFSDVTGPALANVENRGPWTNRRKFYEFISNVPLFVTTNNYGRDLKRKYGSIMTSFDMPIPEMNLLLDYIKNESTRPGANKEEDAYRDSLARLCGTDTFYVATPRQDQSFFQDGDTSTIANSIADSPDTKDDPVKLDDPSTRTIGFTDPNPTSGMYDFEISTFGWYNIDAFMEGYEGTTIVKLAAQVQTDPSTELHMYLLCPDRQIFSVAYERIGDKYPFEKIDGGAPLFIGDRAILFAFGSKDDKIYYGISEFIIKAEQTIPVSITETSDEEIRKALLSKKLNGIDLGIEKKKKVIMPRPCNEARPVDTTTISGQ